MRRAGDLRLREWLPVNFSLAGLATLVIVTGTSTTLIHVFGVSRSALLRFLFNGRSFPRLFTAGQSAK